MTTFLQVFIPLAYFSVTLASIRFVVTRPNLDEFDAKFLGILVGLFWPVAMPVFSVIYEPPKRQAQSKIDRKAAEQDMMEILAEYAKMNRPQLSDGRDHNRPWDEDGSWRS